MTDRERPVGDVRPGGAAATDLRGWTAPDRPAPTQLAGTAVAIVSATSLIVAAAILGRSLWFFSDDWNIYADYHSGNLLEPFNGHLSLLPAGLYQLLFHTTGVGSYLPYRICGLAALAVLGFQVGRFAHERLGPWAAAVAVTAVIWNSAGNTNVLFPFLMNFSLPIAAMFAIWWHLDRADRGDIGPDRPGRTVDRHDVAAAVWLAVALASSGLGLMVVAAVVVELAVTRAPWQRWATLSPGVVAWALWFVTHRDSSPVSHDVRAVAAYAARMLLGGTRSLAAGSRPGGIVLAAAFCALLGWVAVRRGPIDGRALGSLAAVASFVGLTALTRLTVVPHIPPDEMRYRWAIAAYLVGAVLVVWPRRSDGRDSTASPRPLPRWAAPAATLVAFAVLGAGAVQLLDGMSMWTDKVEGATPGMRSALFAVEATGRRRIDPGLVLPLSFVPVTASGYLGAASDVGSPIAGLDPAERTLVGGDPEQRARADRILVDQLPVRATGPDGACSGPIVTSPVAPGSDVEVTGATATVRLGRFSAPAAIPVPLPGGADGRILIPRDDAAVAAAGRSLPYVLAAPGAVLRSCGDDGAGR